MNPDRLRLDGAPGSGRGFPLADGQGWRIHLLRLSVISACNLRCAYCKPQGDGAGLRPLTDGLRVEFATAAPSVFELHRAQEPREPAGSGPQSAHVRVAYAARAFVISWYNQRIQRLATAAVITLPGFPA